MKLGKIYILFVLFFGVGNLFGQYIPLMNGYFVSNQFYNPASAGRSEHMVAYTGLRQQWVRIKGAPSTQMLAFDSPLKKQRFGIGGIYYHDKIGATSTNGLQINYSYRVRISRRKKIAFGVNAGIENQRFKIEEIDLINANDQAFTGQFSNQNKLKIGAGAILYDKYLVIGVSVNDLIKESGFANGIAYLQYKKKINREWTVSPGVLLKMNTLSISQAEFSVLTSYKKQISLNLGFRTNGSIIAGVGVKPKSQLLVMYSYDYVAGHLKTFTAGSHELILKYDFIKKYRVSSPRIF